MPQFIPRASWLSVLVVSLLAVSTVNAHPIHQTEEAMEKGQASKLESRSPVSHSDMALCHWKNTLLTKTQRLIPDTQKYVHDLLQGLGLEEPTPTATATSTPTPTPTATATATASVETTQDLDSMKPTQTTNIIYSSSTIYTPTYSSNGAGYTHTVKHIHSNNRPIENVQIGQGWNGDKKIRTEDIPVVFDTLYRELEHRLNNMIDSSDEIGLDGFLWWGFWVLQIQKETMDIDVDFGRDVNSKGYACFWLYTWYYYVCLLYTSPSPRDGLLSRMPSSAWKKKVCRLLLEKKKFIFFFFFFNDPATTEIYTLHIVGSVRCV